MIAIMSVGNSIRSSVTSSMAVSYTHLEDTKELTEWVRRQRVVALQLYKNGILVYNSEYPEQDMEACLLYTSERRISASPPGLCPVDLASSFLRMCHAQSCGKCVPCRVGLGQLEKLMEDVLDGNATLETIDLIAVSYTHLDVYKRQFLDCSLSILQPEGRG